MSRSLKSLVLAASVSGLAVAPLAIGGVVLMPDAVAAQGASGNSGDRGASGGDRGRSGDAPGRSADRGASASANAGGASSNAGSRGALASELRGLNAANANPQALANAAPDSQVGRIATYREATLAAREINDAYEALEAEVNDDILAIEDQLDELRSSEEIEADLLALGPVPETEPEDPATADERAALQAELDEVLGLEQSIIKLDNDLAELGRERLARIESADAALLAASGGRELSPEAIEELHRLLGL
ncbi:hypothetical protein [Alkalilacustris brevis]|uniref:hypothetical protein n=1 Tax=Alkalilacustris brevis TaxID=2026338 RepID=UPI000E0D0600|nr:hypothetical protein [Alkalilacustris brevis]